MFKVASAGKLTFIIYKDKQLTPANELHEIPIEEYGGLDCTLKMEGERHAFAIITTHSTECFATDSQEVLQEWSHTIREYLGKGKQREIQLCILDSNYVHSPFLSV